MTFSSKIKSPVFSVQTDRWRRTAMLIEAIKEGFHLTHKNWKLIPVRIAVSVINLLSFVFFLGIPGFIAVVYLGFDLAYAREMVPLLIKNPVGFFSKYMGLLSLILIAFSMYLIFSSMLHIYALSGTLGVLRSSAVASDSRFSLALFFREAGQHFTRLFWLLSIMLSGLIVLVAIFGFLGAIGGSFVMSIPDTGAYLTVFIKSFITVSYGIFGVIFLYTWVVVTAFSIMILVVEGVGAAASIRRTYTLLAERPGAFLLYLLLVTGLVAANLIVAPFTLMPFLVPLVNAVIQHYLALVLWSSLIAYHMLHSKNVTFRGMYGRARLSEESPFTG
jgi:hypothetical protein